MKGDVFDSKMASSFSIFTFEQGEIIEMALWRGRIPGKMSVLFKLYYTNKYTIYRCKYFRKMCEQKISNVHRIYHIGDGCFIFINLTFVDKK